jgi:hypothetical protein
MLAPWRHRWRLDILYIGDQRVWNLPVYILFYTVKPHSMAANKTIVLIDYIASFTAYFMILAEISKTSPLMLIIYFDSQLEHFGHLTLTPRPLSLRMAISTIDCAKPKAPAISMLLIWRTPKARLACK